MPTRSKSRIVTLKLTEDQFDQLELSQGAFGTEIKLRFSLKVSRLERLLDKLEKRKKEVGDS